MFDLYLKSLEIQGFKSFPEKTRLTFDRPITGIVGPNGSGKSNISDALLWVMGEQSTKTLRGGKMEDVIFGGTQRRSQVGYAEVSLTLDNSDGRFGLENNEVMLTRRYYRSGESEYYINRSQVRLKDLSELLMDTGLGRDGYSVIGQGRIADLLSTKSKDRREIFEEAAGISRYRHRKEESERKLGQTEENLLRIGDKISELELQVEPLREQAETAKRYLKLRDELRGIEISVWLIQLDTLRAKAEKADSDYKLSVEALDKASQDLDDGYQEIEALEDMTRDCEVDAEAVRAQISHAEQRLSEIESEIAVLKSQMEGNAGQIEHLAQELVSQDESQDGVGNQISEGEKRLGEIADEKVGLEAKTADLIAKLSDISKSAGSVGDELSALLEKETNIKNEIIEDRSRLSALASQAQELYDMELNVKKERAEALTLLENQHTGHKQSKDELDKSKEEVVTLGNIVNGLGMKVDGRVKKAELSGEKQSRISLELKTLQSRKSLLAEMEKEYQGYSKAVKLVMQEQSRGVLKNIHGTVAGLISTSDKYTVAIETALGGAMQNIVVGSEEDGKAAINMLKSRDGGRATFLPLSTIKGNVLGERDISDDPGYEGIALDLVKFDAQYSGVYASLLGRVVIVDSLNSAIRISKKHNQRFRIVTLDGQVINAGGSMTGGSAASNAGVLSRANEINALVGRIETCTTELTQAEKDHAECVREKNEIEYELSTAQAQLRTAEDTLLKLESAHALIEVLISNAKDAVSAFESEIENINKRISLNVSETSDLNASIKQRETHADQIKGDIEKELSGQEQLAQKKEEIDSELSELRANLASLEAEKDALTKSVSDLSAIRDDMLGSRERQLETIDGLKNKNMRIREDIAEKEQISSSILREIDERKHNLNELNDKKLSIEAKRSALGKANQEKNNELLNLQRESSRLEQQKQQAEMEEKQIVDKLWENYELSRSAAVNAGTPVENVVEAQRQISSLKKEISSLGNPNIGAIEEFERVNTRYTFLSEQRDDVRKAKDELLGIIEEITAQMREIFVREFEVINTGFGKTFKELFGGGRAALILEDPDDVLNCGIEIEVQPPGKSLKTLTLLSGGEKAFVAIAIYFAILTVRPPPFVIMDEIDAALDDANVLRFASHMRMMSHNTQMIVISHKRGTMEEVDVLYGVTMQELGVSSLIMLDLDEAEKHMNSKQVTR
ncbi:MAG: chromosome segregation protein SMC [Oscillospiraceae bacterium]|nr:chromosome segregation protein SMC [Oscillospiraceae bacterium]